MKKRLLTLLLLPAALSAQVNFGLKTGLAVPSYKDDNGVEYLGLDNALFYGAFIEYKGLDVSGEFELDYYASSGTLNSRNTSAFYSTYSEVKTLIPSLSVKYYPVDNFNIKAGIYVNSTSLDYRINSQSVNAEAEDLNVDDTGALIGMEAILWKGLFVDARVLMDVNKSDDLRTTNFMLGAGYKI